MQVVKHLFYLDLSKITFRSIDTQLIRKFITGVRIQMQLFNHRYNPRFDRIYRFSNKNLSDTFTVEIFVEHYSLKLTVNQSTKTQDF